MTFAERPQAPVDPASCLRDMRLQLPPFTLSAADVAAFAAEFDAQPMHLDPVAAHDTPLGGLAASGWQTCAATMAAIESELGARGLMLERFAVDSVVWSKPVRPDTALTGTLSLLDSTVCPCSPRSVAAAIEVTDRAGEILMRWSLLGRLSAIGAPVGSTGLCLLDRQRPPRSVRRPSETGLKFFEEIDPGEEIDLGTYTLSHQRCIHFIRHLGAAHRHSPAIMSHAPDWLVAAAWMHCIVRYYDSRSGAAMRAGKPFPRLGPAAGLRHLRWRRRVAVDETLAFRTWAERKIEIASADWGLLIAGAEVVDVNGELVAAFYPQLLLERRSQP